MSARFKDDRAVGRARILRKAMTPAEKLLWRELRKTEPHWRRQAPIGPYIVDFICHAAKLIVELDGGVHRAPDVALRDEVRTAWLTERGYLIQRYANAAIIADVGAVVRALSAEVSACTPTPNPSPQGGGGLLEHS